MCRIKLGYNCPSMLQDIGLRMAVGLFSVLMVCGPLLNAQTGRRLWVLEPPDTIVEYDPATFQQINTQKIPPQVLKNPDHFFVNRKGQMLFVPDVENSSSAEGDGSADKKIWFWDGQKAALLDRNARYASVPAGSNRNVVDAMPKCVLSADGRHLYWFENEFKTLMEGESRDISVSTVFRFWQTDLEGKSRQLLLESALPACDCATSVCSETCPEAELWAPENGIDDFILITYWVPGQIGSDYQSSFISHKDVSSWSLQKLPQPIIQVMDAASGGTVRVEAVPDAGCCGWDNESDDQTLFSRNGKSVVLFDERLRYKNPDYDVSFFTPGARLSPDFQMVAMTIVSSSRPGSDVRLSSDGKPDQAELERILNACLDLPAVEVLKLSNLPARAAFIAHATMVDWLDNHEVLLFEDSELVAFDPATRGRRKSGIGIQQPSFVFIR
jgi:hypothetical protein